MVQTFFMDDVSIVCYNNISTYTAEMSPDWFDAHQDAIFKAFPITRFAPYYSFLESSGIRTDKLISTLNGNISRRSSIPPQTI